MTGTEPRNAAERKADTLAKLRAPAMDVWVASASVSESGSARPYLVPVSLAWLDERVVIAIESDSRTARNITEQGAARLALGPTRDVVIIDAVLDQAIDLADAPPALAEGYAAQADWDPRTASGRFVYVVLRPDRIQAWREADELPGRTLMRSGSWIV
jgi:Pyridoxamine 5'-phosphate oxidase